MTLAAGTRLGPYEVLGPIGAGGMGEVYRARDTRLGRDVAIKVLPADRLSDEVQRARFAREARAASALNHPSIVTIHEIESDSGVAFIVMELVPGRNLRTLIPRQGLPVPEVLSVAIPLADALAAAHAAGVVHRDLKPANVMVTPQGVVKVLDFGLAKLLQKERAGPEETTAEAGPLSQPGAITGTFGYMSPEQASGGSVDARSDVFSFGLLLYEMVTGRRPFGGGSSAEVLAALLREEPKPPSELVPEVPKELERIIQRCLRKEPDRRFQHMGDVKVELQEVKEDSDSQASAPANSIATARRSLAPRIARIAAAALVLAAAATLTLWRLQRPHLPPPTVVQLTSARRAGAGSFSPDGTQIAYSSAGDDGANRDIWLKIVGEAEARRLTTDPAPEDAPAWSPDGKEIAFLRETTPPGSQSGTFWTAATVHLVSPLGGPTRRMSDFLARGQLSWSPDGRWLAAAIAGGEGPRGLHLISTATGTTRAVTFPKPSAVNVNPAFSLDGRALAYASCEGAERNPVCDVYVLSLDSELRPRGAARRLTRQRLWNGGVAWMRDGRSIVYGADPGPYLWRVRADDSAPPERVELAGRGASHPSTAESQDRLSFVRGFWDPDIYRLQLGAPPTPLVASTFADFAAQYSPDGRRIAFYSGRAGDVGEIWLANADGSDPTRLTRGPGREQGSPQWSPDGRSIAFDSQAESGHVDIWTIGVDGSGLREVTHDPADDMMPSWSRDGRFLYFVSNRTARGEIWRIPAEGGTEEPITREGGSGPLLSLDGRTLYYQRPSDNALVARPTAGGRERTVLRCVDPGNYAVAPQGILHVECGSPQGPTGSRRVLGLWDAATGQDQPVASIESTFIAGLSVSPDGRTILYGQSSWGTADLMMIENFR